MALFVAAPSGYDPIRMDRGPNTDRTDGGRPDRGVRWRLAGLILLAVLLRGWAAMTPGFHHPDAIYQYLEPAHRLLTGEGVITWEWRTGIRSWLLPAMLSGPAWLGERIAAPMWLTVWLPVLLPRLTMAVASLGIVWSGWRLGRRVAPQAAWLAAFITATWFECVYFGAQTLAEPLATAAFLPAAVLVTGDAPGRRPYAAAGALLTFAVLMRPHYAPAAAALLLTAAWPAIRAWRQRAGAGAGASGPGAWRAAIPCVTAFALGCLPVLLVSTGVDVATGAVPFAWIVENVRQNIVEHRAEAYGVLPPLTYVVWFGMLWHYWTIPLLIGVRFGWRLCPALLVAALVNVVLHSLIGHKEYRFVFLTSAALVTLSAVGWGVLLQSAARRWPGPRARIATLAVAASWAAASLLLTQSDEMRRFIDRGRAGSLLFAAIRQDSATCGVALVDRPAFADVPGRVSLRTNTPLFMILRGDPALEHADPWIAANRWQAGYNRIIATLPAGHLPQGYSPRTCAPVGEYNLCLFARSGPCTPVAASPFALDRAMLRLGF